jgi:hypothetical protein
MGIIFMLTWQTAACNGSVVPGSETNFLFSDSVCLAAATWAAAARKIVFSRDQTAHHVL